MSIIQVSCDLPDGVESVIYPDEEEEEDIAMLTPDEEMLVEGEDQLEIDEGKFFFIHLFPDNKKA